MEDFSISKYIQRIENQYNVKVLYLTVYGSRLYGTHSENSDVDYKGVFLPCKRDLLLQKRRDHITYSTADDSHKNSKDDFDVQLWSLQWWINATKLGDSGALDLLFSLSNKDAVVFYDEKFKNFVEENYSSFCDRYNTRAFLGFATSQAVKYGMKGSKLNVLNTVYDFLESLRKRDDFDSSMRFESFMDDLYLYLVKELGVNKSFYNIFKTEDEKAAQFSKRYFRLIGKCHHNVITFSEFHRRVCDQIDEYGHRAKQASSANGVDWKAVSHCLRVLYQALELMKTGKISFPLKNSEEIKAVKYGEIEYSSVEKLISDKMMEVEEILKNNESTFVYPQELMDNFICSFY